MGVLACAEDHAGYHDSRRGGNGVYPYPFLDPASQAGPKTWRDINAWGRMCILKSPEFMDAQRKKYAYFATDVDFSASSSDDQQMSMEEVKSWREIYSDSLSYSENLIQMGMGVALFGSQIVTLQSKCRRYLRCPHPECGFMVDMLKGVREMSIDFKFDYGRSKFLFRCPGYNCPNRKRRVAAVVKDLHSRSPDDLYIKQWDPEEMIIDYYLWTDSDDIYWRIPEYYKQALRRGHLETLAEADLDVLDAARNNQLFRFYRDRVFHAKELAPAGSGLRGRGIPQSLLLAPQIWSMNVLRHQNQVLGMDYIIPMGFFSMEEQQKGGTFSDPMVSMDVGGFTRDIEAAMSEHRRNPTKRFAFPYTVRYQVAGGEANQFAPVAMLESAKTDIYDASGVPLEMWRGSLAIQVMPVAARLFEASHVTIPSLYNRFTAFVVRRTAEEMNKPAVKARHQKSSVVADIQRQATLMQGLQMGHIARSTVYDAVDVDTSVERERRTEEILEDARAESEINKKLEADNLSSEMKMMPAPNPTQQQDPAAQVAAPAAQTAMPGSMQPSQGLAVADMSLEELSAEAQRIASQLIDPSLPQSEVNSQLQSVRAESQELHTLVRGEMEKMRRQAASMGQTAVLSGQI